MQELIFFFSQGWTLFEILRYAPQHNWSAYEEALKTNPVLAKMMISGVVYSLGDWIAQVSWWFWSNYDQKSLLLLNLLPTIILFMFGDMQCVEGKPLFEFDRTRMFRSGLVGFTLHGSLSHYYYQFCEVIMMPWFLSWWLLWLEIWNTCVLLKQYLLIFRNFFLFMIGGSFLLK